KLELEDNHIREQPETADKPFENREAADESFENREAADKPLENKEVADEPFENREEVLKNDSKEGPIHEIIENLSDGETNKEAVENTQIIEISDDEVVLKKGKITVLSRDHIPKTANI
ncbi:3125_t:CDS:1, partial [Dentiscutata erythropus]